MDNIDFLKPGIQEIKKSIIDIDDSYNNDWDILAELLQNSVDAIKQEKPKKATISIEVNSQTKSIIVKDNGVGIDPNDLASLLAPFSTNKDNDEESIGEKGVGLTFVLFSCNNFSITSGNKNGTKTGVIIDAYNWKTSRSNDRITIKLKDESFELQGTEITLESIDDSPLFKLTYEQLKYVIRTKTAIGNTNFLWGEDIKIDVIFKHTNLDGKFNEEVLENKFWMVYDNLNNKTKIDLDEFIKYANDADRTDQDKRKKLQDKIIYKKGEFEFQGRTIKYTTCFVPKRKVWDMLSVDMGLCTEENIENGDWLDEYEYSKFTSGIYTSVKGMPTGITIDHPSTGYAGYWSNIFIMFEDKHLKFDIGRKSIHGMTSRKYKNFARDIFNLYLKYITKYVSGEVIQSTEWDKEEIFAEIEQMIDLRNDKTKFVKTPKDQEASVAGIFFECIGNGIIDEIKPLISGYRNRYDLYAKWGHKNVVIEFKSKLKNILKDFNDEQKLFDEIDMIVCWNIIEEDEQAMSDKGITLEEVEHSSLSTQRKKMIPNTTHELILSGITKPIYIMDLKKVLEEAE
ncbi:MAG: ATP-binding protein [Poseidonibacter sp.]|uniref:ATP-binding protein n=1 Tax=Poseidonibacter sp. TaxID=2321188 RepID=UPI00359CC5DF